MFENKNTFIDLDQKEVSREDVIKDIVSKASEGYTIAIGSDSQKISDKICLVTSVCAHHYKKGAVAYYIKQRISQIEFPTLRSRMSLEAFSSVEMAIIIRSFIPDSKKVQIHLDIGSDPKKCKTFKFKKELTSMVLAQGFTCEVKPKSWASGVADWFTKN